MAGDQKDGHPENPENPESHQAREEDQDQNHHQERSVVVASARRDILATGTEDSCRKSALREVARTPGLRR